jgi:hypothetical protein
MCPASLCPLHYAGNQGRQLWHEWPQHRIDSVFGNGLRQLWDRVAQALDEGYPVNARAGHMGFTLLHRAASYGHMPTLLRLLTAGADVDVRDNNGKSPMHFAAICFSTLTLAALVKAGADGNARDSNLESPLFFAVAGSLPCTYYLLSLPQVEVAATNEDGETAESRARAVRCFGAADAVRTEVCVAPRRAPSVAPSPPPFSELLPYLVSRVGRFKKAALFTACAQLRTSCAPDAGSCALDSPSGGVGAGSGGRSRGRARRCCNGRPQAGTPRPFSERLIGRVYSLRSMPLLHHQVCVCVRCSMA